MLGQLVNGARSDCIGLDERALQYGDGLFETIAVHAGRPRLWTRHMARLSAGCERLHIPPPDPGLLRSEAAALLADSAAEQAVLKIILGRGRGGRGYRPPREPRPTRILTLHPWPSPPPAPLRLRLCTTRLGTNPALAGLKHLNRLEQVLARAEPEDDAFDEGLMCDAEGRVVEAIQHNLFGVWDNVLITPPVHRCGVAGVMRALVIELAQGAGIEAREGELDLPAVRGAGELFLTNALHGIVAVGSFGTRRYAAPGPLTRRLQRALDEFGEA